VIDIPEIEVKPNDTGGVARLVIAVLVFAVPLTFVSGVKVTRYLKLRNGSVASDDRLLLIVGIYDLLLDYAMVI
jgi:tagatose-1,6-bisphosphate aldolase non-catalytic subunit AgaZ/GatZ